MRSAGAVIAAGLMAFGPGWVAAAEETTADASTPVVDETAVIAPSAAAEPEPPVAADAEPVAEAPVDVAPVDAAPVAEAPAAAEPVEEPSEPPAAEPAHEPASEPAIVAPEAPEEGEPTADSASVPDGADATAQAEMAAPAAVGDALDHTFVVGVALMDDAGELPQKPVDFDWTITATGPATYDSSLYGVILQTDPVPGAYALDVELNAAAAAELRFDSVQCVYEEILGIPAEVEIQYTDGSRWFVDVRPEHLTGCTIWYELVGQLPDPHVALQDVLVLGAVDPSRNRLHAGESSDWALALTDHDGFLHATASVGGEVAVPAGLYTRELVASAGAQAAFDPDVWHRSEWNCSGSLPGGYHDGARVEAGFQYSCSIFVTDADADLVVDVDHLGDVALGWDGVEGAVGSEFEIVVDVENSLTMFPTVPEVGDLRVTVELGDNVELIAPDAAPQGWTLVAVDGPTYTYAATGPLGAGASASFSLPARLTAADATSPVRVCATTGLNELAHDNNCMGLATVSDGDPDPGTNPDPEPDPEPEPEPQPQPEPEPGTVTEPVPTPTQAAQQEEPKKGETLAATGAELSTPLLAGAASLLLLGAWLLRANRRRTRG